MAETAKAAEPTELEERLQSEWGHDTMIEGLWRTGEKQEVSILYEREDKSRYSGQAEAGTREWKDFFFKFTTDQVDAFADAHRAQREARGPRPDHQKQIQKREDKQAVERKKAADELESLFRAKLEAFEIPEVRDSENRDLRSRIRKSKSLTEISALVASLITLSIIRVTLRAENLLDETPEVKDVSGTIEEVANEVPKDEN